MEVTEDVTAGARLLAVEVLLATPELLSNDALEGDLYILRDTLRTKLKAGIEMPCMIVGQSGELPPQ